MSDQVISTLCAQFGVAYHNLDEVISDLHLDEIGLSRCTYWRSLPTRLGLSNVVAKDIGRDFQKEYERRCEFFQQWKQEKGSEATYRSLVRALLDTKQRLDAEYVCKLASQAISTNHPPDIQPSPAVTDSVETTSTTSEDSLHKESAYDKIKSNFASLMFSLQRDLEKRHSVGEVVNIVVFYNNNFDPILAECTNVPDVFRKVSQFVSFFYYDLLRYVIKQGGSDAIKKELHKYKDYFREFSKSRVVKCPSNIFSDRNIESPKNILVLVADKIYEDLTIYDLKKFKQRLNLILGNKLLKVLRIKRGSICLTFQVFEDRDFTITEEQRQALQREGVISITYGDHCFDIRTPEMATSAATRPTATTRPTVTTGATATTIATTTASTRSLTIIFTGKRGAGKSSLVDILKKKKKKPQKLQANTTLMEEEFIKENGVTIRFIDPPGFRGTTDDLKQLKMWSEGKADLLVYCLPVGPGHKFHDCNPEIMRSLTEAYGKRIWDHCVLVLTMSNSALSAFKDDYEVEDYPDRAEKAAEEYKKILKWNCTNFKEQLCNLGVEMCVKTVFEPLTGDIANTIIAVPAGKTPRCQVLPGLEYPLPDYCEQNWISLLIEIMQTKCTAERAHWILQYQYGEERFTKLGAIPGGTIGGILLPVIGAAPRAEIGYFAGLKIVEYKVLKKDRVEQIERELVKCKNKEANN